MKKYLMVFRIRFINNIQYRASAIAGIATQIVWAIMGILAYKACFKAMDISLPMNFAQIATYLWIQQAFLPFFAMWFLDGKIFNAISTGTVAYELIRPVGLYDYWYSQSMANRLSYGILRSLPVLIVALLVPEPYRMLLPTNNEQFLLFVLSAILSLCVVVAFSMLIYISTFYTISGWGLRIIISSLSDFLAGAVIPLPFFPKEVQNIANILPFASMLNLPLRIYTGNLEQTEIYWGILLQIFWLVVLVAFGRSVIKRALHKVTIQGG